MAKVKNPTKYFYDLTPERIHDAFAQAGMEIQPGVTFLNSLENRVVRVVDSEGERWVAKFYRPGRWTTDALYEEHDFLDECHEEGLPVVVPVSLDSGEETVGETVGIYFSIFPYQHGRPPDEIDAPLAYQAGALVGRLHRLGQQGRFRHRPRLGPQYWGLEALRNLEQEEVVPSGLWPRYRGAVERLVERTQKSFDRYPSFRLHGDLHRGNFLVTSQGPVLVDFDDCGTGPAVQDLWLLISGRDSEAQELRELMLEGYELHLPFDRSQLELIEPLRALKFIHYAAWVARRRKDPAFSRLFPDVESFGFWRRELEDLEAQMEHFS